MLPDHVEPQVLENLEIVNHCLASRRRMQPIRPVSLVKGAKDECEFAVEERALDAVDRAPSDGAEPRVAGHLVLAEGDGEVVQVWCVGRPDLDVVDGE